MKGKQQANTDPPTKQQLAKLKPESLEDAIKMVEPLNINADNGDDLARMILGISQHGNDAQNFLLEAVFLRTGCYLDALQTYKRAIREGYSPDEGFSPYHFYIYDEGGERAFVPALRRDEKPSSDPLALADAIAAVVNHPDCPNELYNAMAETLCEYRDDLKECDPDINQDMLRIWIPKLIADKNSEQEVEADEK